MTVSPTKKNFEFVSAPTNRANCKVCKKLVAQESWKFVANGHSYHPQCIPRDVASKVFTKHKKGWQAVKGFKDLDEENQKAISLIAPEENDQDED